MFLAVNDELSAHLLHVACGGDFYNRDVLNDGIRPARDCASNAGNLPGSAPHVLRCFESSSHADNFVGGAKKQAAGVRDATCGERPLCDQ